MGTWNKSYLQFGNACLFLTCLLFCLFLLQLFLWLYYPWTGVKTISQAYIKTLKNLNQHFCRVWPHRNLADLLLIHDIARPHTSLARREAISKSGCTVLSHPPYKPDLAASDCHPFGPLKDWLSGGKFEDEGVIHPANKWLHDQDKIKNRLGIHALV